MTALHIKSNGEQEYITPGNGDYFSLEELQSLVGGNIEMLLTKDQRTIIVNNEGKLKNLEVNTESSKIMNREPVLGDVLVCDWST